MEIRKASGRRNDKFVLRSASSRVATGNILAWLGGARVGEGGDRKDRRKRKKEKRKKKKEKGVKETVPPRRQQQQQRRRQRERTRYRVRGTDDHASVEIIEGNRTTDKTIRVIYEFMTITEVGRHLH
jgi:hypothetical protein